MFGKCLCRIEELRRSRSQVDPCEQISLLATVIDIVDPVLQMKSPRKFKPGDDEHPVKRAHPFIQAAYD
ncbi:hypothetical protein M433DRAFT_159875 [Acidomyces richmondensis BFW]|nr:hypothetical protein M433DRAFT_159875 [Acidomyces richmondensis BFW]